MKRYFLWALLGAASGYISTAVVALTWMLPGYILDHGIPPMLRSFIFVGVLTGVFIARFGRYQ